MGKKSNDQCVLLALRLFMQRYRVHKLGGRRKPFELAAVNQNIRRTLNQVKTKLDEIKHETIEE
jgi:hypothetical protein